MTICIHYPKGRAQLPTRPACLNGIIDTEDHPMHRFRCSFSSSRPAKALLPLVALAGFVVTCFTSLGGRAADKPAPVRHGMVVAVSPPGAEVGRDILQKGGNAV